MGTHRPRGEEGASPARQGGGCPSMWGPILPRWRPLCLGRCHPFQEVASHSPESWPRSPKGESCVWWEDRGFGQILGTVESGNQMHIPLSGVLSVPKVTASGSEGGSPETAGSLGSLCLQGTRQATLAGSGDVRATSPVGGSTTPGGRRLCACPSSPGPATFALRSTGGGDTGRERRGCIQETTHLRESLRGPPRTGRALGPRGPR